MAVFPVWMQLSMFFAVVLVSASVIVAQSQRQNDPQTQQSITTQSPTVQLATQLPTVQLTLTNQSTIEPCAQVAAIVNPLKAADPKGPSPMVSGSLAFDCLNSVPLHKMEALGLAGALLPYARFQSDLAFKKNPPSGYPMKPVDLIESLTRIVDNLTTDVYPNERAWAADTFRVMMSSKDGHFRFAPDILGKAFRFVRDVGIVSVSMDGIGLPQIYMLDDLNKTLALGQTFKPSPVTQINGQEAVSHMEDQADLGFQQDPDTAYNSMFYNIPANYDPASPFQYGYFAGSQRYALFYPGPNTTFTFANGSTMVIETMAKVVGNFSNVVDGESFYQRFCVPVAKPAESATSPVDPPPPAFTGLPPPDTVVSRNYPKPQVAASDSTVSAYYLTSSAHKDVGVIALNNFSPTIPQEFQAVVQTMLAEMKRDGKNKLIVDLSFNPGGSVLQGVDTFRQLFPTIQDQSLGRYHIHPALMEMVQATTQILPTPFDPNTASLDMLTAYYSHYNYLSDINSSAQHFTDLPSKFVGQTIASNNYSNLFQFDFSDPMITTNDTTGSGMEITGYGSRSNFTQPFAPENIIMLSDGICASTCSLFAEMMRIQGGVKTVAIGGRPSTSQIQTIGGVKGASENSFQTIFNAAKFRLQNLNQSELSKYPNLASLSDLPFRRSIDDGMNVQDHILPANFEDGLPAQYVNEPADCRLFYTPAMVLDITKMWEAVADAAFDGKLCVAGGISVSKTKRNAVVEKREEWVRRRDMPRLKRDVWKARSLLARARAKPIRRFGGWESIHGRALPNIDVH